MCQSGGSPPCKCAAQLSCAEQLQRYGITYPLPSVSRTSPTSAIITWQSPDPNAPRTIHHVRLRMAPASAGVDILGQCNSCVVNEQNIDPYTQSSYTVDGLLTAGTLYWVQLLAYGNQTTPLPTTCGHGELVKHLSSCTLSPDPMTLAVGESQTMTTELPDADGVAVTYQSSVPSVAMVTNVQFPHLRPGQTRTTTVTGVSNGTTVVTNKAELEENGTWVDKCTDSATVNVGTPVGTIRARAVQIDPSDTTCTAIRAAPTSGTEVNGTQHSFTASSASQPPAQTQSGANYMNFTGVVTGSYTLVSEPPAAGNWSFARACWRNETTGAAGEGFSQTLVVDQTIRWDVGYTKGTAWVQTEGGDVYAAGTLTSSIPSGITPRVFAKNGSGGYPGVVTYGTSYDLDADIYSSGSTLVSSTNWLVNTTYSQTDYFDYFYRRFSSPTTPTTDAAFSNPLAVTKPPSSTIPYYVVGDITTSGNWSVGNGQSITILVNGNLTLGGRVNITGNGFIAFIVKGTITVSDSVGVAAGSSTPVVEGLYVTSPLGLFDTGNSTVAGAERFVGEGMFVSGNFSLGRNLESVGANTTTPAELFIYNPGLLMRMPDAMMALPVTWQEVAP